MKLTKVLEHKIIIRIMKENKGGGDVLTRYQTLIPQIHKAITRPET